jgi:hypothetical protein
MLSSTCQKLDNIRFIKRSRLEIITITMIAKRMRIKKLLIRMKMVKNLLTVLETTTITIIIKIFLKGQNLYLGNRLMKMRLRKLNLQAVQ